MTHRIGSELSVNIELTIESVTVFYFRSWNFREHEFKEPQDSVLPPKMLKIFIIIILKYMRHIF